MVGSRSESSGSGGPSLLKQLRRDLRRFVATELRTDNLVFCLIYGSFAYGVATAHSDLDVMIVVRDADVITRSACVAYLVQLHKRYGLQLDNEIPYEVKVVIPLDVLARACDGVGFKDALGQWYIPAIVKTPECLRSQALLMRFLLGMMNHKHIHVAGSEQEYRRLRLRAGEGLLRAVFAARETPIVTVCDAVSLLTWNGEVTGDYYLGFRDSTVMRRYLAGYLADLLRRLCREGKAVQTPDGFSLHPLLASDAH